jgi:hypothetical protein
VTHEKEHLTTSVSLPKKKCYAQHKSITQIATDIYHAVRPPSDLLLVKQRKTCSLPKTVMNNICSKCSSCPIRPSKIFSPARDNVSVLFTIWRFNILLPPLLTLCYEHVRVCCVCPLLSSTLTKNKLHRFA